MEMEMVQTTLSLLEKPQFRWGETSPPASLAMGFPERRGRLDLNRRLPTIIAQWAGRLLGALLLPLGSPIGGHTYRHHSLWSQFRLWLKRVTAHQKRANHVLESLRLYTHSQRLAETHRPGVMILRRAACCDIALLGRVSPYIKHGS